MEPKRVAHFNVPAQSDSGLQPGVVGIVITTMGTFLGKFVKTTNVSHHNLYYFTVMYSNKRELEQGKETYVLDYQIKHFIPVQGPIQIIKLFGDTYIITSKQTYPL